MNDILKNIKKDQVVYFIGIGGTGMSGLAQCVLARGLKVAGSDTVANEATTQLQDLGSQIFIGQQARNLLPSTVLVVRSAAIKEDNPELREAQKRKLPVLKYAELLGELMKARYGIAVSGCHGKTTTTALISYILEKSGQQPSFVVGGYVPSLKSSARAGAGKHFVAEACEFDRSFHHLHPKMLVINNIEPDHLDYYRDLDEIIESFHVLAAKVPADGFVVINQDDQNVMVAVRDIQASVVSCGLNSPAEWQAKNIKLKKGQWYFEVWRRDEKFGEFSVAIPGQHNVRNALSMIVVLHLLGLKSAAIKKYLPEFKGVGRRFETVGRLQNVTVIDDYAHHPTEIKAVLKAARQLWPRQRIWCVFQPHQASRTRCFLDEFARVFTQANMTIVPDIYFARDSAQAKKDVNAQDLVRKIIEQKSQAIYLPTFEKIIDYLKQNTSGDDIIITMGAGDIGQVARALVS